MRVTGFLEILMPKSKDVLTKRYLLFTFSNLQIIREKNEYKGMVIKYGSWGLQNGRGGGLVKFYPYKKGGKSFTFSHAEVGGGTKSFGVVFTQ